MDPFDWIQSADRYARMFQAVVPEDAGRLARWAEAELADLGPWTVCVGTDGETTRLEASCEQALAFRLDLDHGRESTGVRADFLGDDLHAFADYVLLCEDMIGRFRGLCGRARDGRLPTILSPRCKRR